MIYLCVDSIMNGTVTMKIHQAGIEANSFKEAISKFKEVVNKNSNKDNVVIIEESENRFSYYVNQDNEISLTVSGYIDKEPLKMLGE